MIDIANLDDFKKATIEVIDSVADEYEIDDDGDVIFGNAGVKYACIFSNRDPAFVAMVLPNFFSIEPKQIDQANAIIAKINKENKVVKVYLNDDGMASASVELLASHPEYFDKPMINRCIKTLSHAAWEFMRNMREQG